MDVSRVLVFLMLSSFFVSCSDDSEEPAPDARPSTNGLPPNVQTSTRGLSVSISGETSSDVRISGKCTGSAPVQMSGAIIYEAACSEDVFNVALDLSFMPSGRFPVEVTQGSEEMTAELIIQNFSSLQSAFYAFDNANVGEDSVGAYTVTPTDVVSVEDTERGSVAEFQATSSFELSDGSFFNDEFSKRTYSFWMKSSEFTGIHYLIEEGGTSNGFVVAISSNEWVLSAREGGNITEWRVPHSISTSVWTHLSVSYDSGSLIVYQDGLKVFEQTNGPSSIPKHSDAGGVGREYGGGSAISHLAERSSFIGQLDEVRIFDVAIDSSTAAFLSGQTPSSTQLDALSVGMFAHYEFQDVSSPGTDSTGDYPAQTVANVGISSDERGASFDETSSFELTGSGDNHWNESFSTFGVGLWSRPGDLLRNQVLLDRGGSTNGVSIYLENGMLVVSSRSGGESSQVHVLANLIDYSARDLRSQWFHIFIQLAEGKTSIYLNGEKENERLWGYSSIAAHGNDGGLGRAYSSISSDESFDPFVGRMDDVRMYSRPLSSFEIKAMYQR